MCCHYMSTDKGTIVYEKFSQSLFITIKDMELFIKELAHDSWEQKAALSGFMLRADLHIVDLIEFAKKENEPRLWNIIVGRLDYPLIDAIKYATLIGSSNHYWNSVANRKDLITISINTVLEICKNVTNANVWVTICGREDYPIEDAIIVAKYFKLQQNNNTVWNVVANRFLK